MRAILQSGGTPEATVEIETPSSVASEALKLTVPFACGTSTSRVPSDSATTVHGLGEREMDAVADPAPVGTVKMEQCTAAPRTPVMKPVAETGVPGASCR
jgi:hypothetical protein